METRPEHRKCWESLVGLYMGNSSAMTLDTNPMADLMGTDTARRAMVETASREGGVTPRVARLRR